MKNSYQLVLLDAREQNGALHRQSFCHSIPAISSAIVILTVQIVRQGVWVEWLCMVTQLKVTDGKMPYYLSICVYTSINTYILFRQWDLVGFNCKTTWEKRCRKRSAEKETDVRSKAWCYDRQTGNTVSRQESSYLEVIFIGRSPSLHPHPNVREPLIEKTLLIAEVVDSLYSFDPKTSPYSLRWLSFKLSIFKEDYEWEREK